MHRKRNIPLMLLMWDCPWPPTQGVELRNLGLLKELGMAFDVDLVLLELQPLSEAQRTVLQKYTRQIIRVPVKKSTFLDRLRTFLLMFGAQLPYHSAVLEVSFRDYPDILERIRNFQGIVYASVGHWATFIRHQHAPNWIIDQHNADIDFWRVYASQSTHRLMKWSALVNWRLADIFYRRVYRQIGRVVSVCESDKQLTLGVAPYLPVDVIENGIDCAEYSPDRTPREQPLRLLFTGTSAMRNMIALHQFVREIFPLVRQALPDVELLVGGNFSPQAQSEFSHQSHMRFTGRVDDIRPLFNQSDIYIAPFQETHGSKLKIAEAMAMSIPIVATPEGVRGFPLQDGESVLIAHNPAEFAAHIVDLAHCPARREHIGAAGREIALRSIDWHVLGMRLHYIVESTWDRVPKIAANQEIVSYSSSP